MRIALIIPYFGKFPVWFDLYLYSCSKNPQVDFLFFTDCALPERIYNNTIFHKTDFESYCKRVSESLSISFHPKDPYKLCDLKPFYGIIHQAELEEYDFWGFGDIDLIYGDLNIIVNQENLRKYDFITTHSDRVAGHFSIMRKSSKYTHLCIKIQDWRRCLEDSRHYALDEEAWCNIIYPELKNIGRVYRHIVERFHLMGRWSFYNLCGKLFCNRYTKCFFWEFRTTPLPRKGDTWLYNLGNGVVKESGGGEIPYIHFLPFKKNQYFKLEYCWEGDFYTIKNEDLLNQSGKIIVDVCGIKYKK